MLDLLRQEIDKLGFKGSKNIKKLELENKVINIHISDGREFKTLWFNSRNKDFSIIYRDIRFNYRNNEIPQKDIDLFINIIKREIEEEDK